MILALKIEVPEPDAARLEVLLQHTPHTLERSDLGVFIVTGTAVPHDVDFSDLEQVSSAWRTARDFVGALNGAIALNAVAIAPIKLITMMYENEHGVRCWMPIGGRISARVQMWGGMSSQTVDLIALAAEDAPSARVLRLWGKAESWSDYYRILEVITDDIGEEVIVSSGWTTWATLDHFTMTANHPTLSNDDARHGVMPGKPRRKPMELSAARSLVESIVRRWLQVRSDERGPRSPGADSDV